MQGRNYRVVVLVTEAEYLRLKELAGHEPLSSYCRRMLVGSEPRREGKAGERSPRVPPAINVYSAEMPTDPKPEQQMDREGKADSNAREPLWKGKKGRIV